MPRAREATGVSSVNIEVRIAVAWSENDDCFIAWSPQLGSARDGASAVEAVGMCQEAIEVRVESWIERGTLEQSLMAHGYRKRDESKPRAKAISSWHNEEPLSGSSAPSPHLAGLINHAQVESITIKSRGREARVG